MVVAVITNKPYSSLETFIKAQIDLLPYTIEHFWGFRMPFQYQKKNTISDKISKRLKKFLPESAEQDILREFKKRKIDVVLAHYGMMGVEILPVCMKLNLPIVIHFHGHDAVRKSIIEKYGNGYRRLFSYSKSKIISVSKEMTIRLIKLGCPREKIFYNTYGPIDDFLKVKALYNKTQFIAIGRFVEKKAPQILILAFKKVVEAHPEAKLVMAGDGILKDCCVDLVEALYLEKNIFFPGKITPADYRKFLSESIAFVQHSIEAQDGDMEGTPVAILEASAAGVPVISTLSAGIPDVVIDQYTGLLSKEKDIMAMAKNMLWMFENREKAIEMGKKGRKRIEENFSMDQHIGNLSQLIKSMV